MLQLYGIELPGCYHNWGGGGEYIQFNTLANVNDENLYNLGSIFMQ